MRLERIPRAADMGTKRSLSAAPAVHAMKRLFSRSPESLQTLSIRALASRHLPHLRALPPALKRQALRALTNLGALGALEPVADRVLEAWLSSDKFNTLLEDRADCAAIFDACAKIIEDTDLLKDDTAEFMLQPPALLTPLRALSREELLMLMWNVKYRNEQFLFERWRLLFADACRQCADRPPRSYLTVSYSAEDIGPLRDALFDRANFCAKCGIVLFEIVNDDDFE